MSVVEHEFTTNRMCILIHDCILDKYIQVELYAIASKTRTLWESLLKFISDLYVINKVVVIIVLAADGAKQFVAYTFK